MAVNLSPPKAEDLFPVAGVELGCAEAGIRKANRTDLLLVRLCEGSRVAGVFTKNRFCAAPVQVSRKHLAATDAIRALVVNAGNANAGTGEAGVERAWRTCAAVAQALGCSREQVLSFSTGVILEPLPVEKIEAALPRCAANLGAGNWHAAAHAIMTTDTVAKAAARRVTVDGRTLTITGIAKGVGMLQPNMATMLAFIATDAVLGAGVMPGLIRDVADHSFNRVSVDGDTSTNDSFVLIATGRAAGAAIESTSSRGYAVLREALIAVAAQLARSIARDGEGATKFISVAVEGGRDENECAEVAFKIANSPLVKTAFFASDPNLGRILMAIGNANVDIDPSKVDVYLDEVLIVRQGARAPSYAEADGQRVMRQAEIVVRVLLNRGAARTTVWTCDFSYDYVKINAEYRT